MTLCFFQNTGSKYKISLHFRNHLLSSIPQVYELDVRPAGVAEPPHFVLRSPYFTAFRFER